MQYIKAAEINDLKDGEKRKLNINNTVLLLVNVQGTYYAINNKCPHMGGSLYDGKQEGYNITCPRHGSVFDVRNGAMVKNGKLLFMNVKESSVKAYPVKIEGSDVLIGMEE